MSRPLSVRALARGALMTSVTCILAQVSFATPFGVPLTLQTFSIALSGYLCGAAVGGLSVAAYLLLGGVGLPAFAGFRGGVGVLFGVTGGFLWGFLPMALLCGAGERLRPWARVTLGLFGLLLCHLLGSLQFSFVSGNPFLSAVALVSLPYLPKDVISVVAAYALSGGLKRWIPSLRERGA